MIEFNFWEISSGSTQIHLMEYGDFEQDSYIEHLSEIEFERFKTFRHVKRRREFIATRILRKRVLGDQKIQYNSIGAPFIEGVGYISISHSSHLVGLAFNKDHAVGLDLETPRENILDIVPKFLATVERYSFDSQNKLEMTRVWSAKEALYKLAGRKKIIFKEELLLSKSESGEWLGKIINPDHTLSVQLDIFDHQGTVVSINNCEIERIG
jgi:phosphopantetheinyl transferase